MFAFSLCISFQNSKLERKTHFSVAVDEILTQMMFAHLLSSDLDTFRIVFYLVFQGKCQFTWRIHHQNNEHKSYRLVFIFRLCIQSNYGLIFPKK